MNVFWDAIGNNDLKEVLRLIDFGCDVNGQDEEGHTPLHDAVNSAFEIAIMKCDEKGIKVPLDYSIISALIQNGADSSTQDNEGDTPLDWVKKRKAFEELDEIKKLIDMYTPNRTS